MLVLYHNSCTSDFWHRGFLRLLLYCVLRKLWYRKSPSSGTLSQTLDFENFATACPPSPSATNNSKSSSAIDNTGDEGECVQVLSTVDQRWSPVDHTQRPALCITWLADGHDESPCAGLMQFVYKAKVIAYSAPGNPCMMDSSTLGTRHRLWHDWGRYQNHAAAGIRLYITLQRGFWDCIMCPPQGSLEEIWRHSQNQK